MSYLEEQPGRPAKSRGLSIFLWIFGIIGLLIVLACGGIILTMFVFIKRATSQNPAEVRAVAQEIVDVDVPDGLEPKFSVSFQGMRMVLFTKAEDPGSGMLSLTEFPAGQGVEGVQDEQMREEMRRSMQGQAPQMEEIDEAKSEDRTYTIRGEERTVTVQRGAGEDGKQWVQAIAHFTSKQGNEAMLTYMAPADDWDEAEFEAMLESMK
jgi:hypothetical protein